jgi:hypothetical protein
MVVFDLDSDTMELAGLMVTVADWSRAMSRWSEVVNGMGNLWVILAIRVYPYLYPWWVTCGFTITKYLWWRKVSRQLVLAQNCIKSLQPSFKHKIDISLSEMRGIENYHIWKVFIYEAFCAWNWDGACSNNFFDKYHMDGWKVLEK